MGSFSLSFTSSLLPFTSPTEPTRNYKMVDRGNGRRGRGREEGGGRGGGREEGMREGNTGEEWKDEM